MYFCFEISPCNLWTRKLDQTRNESPPLNILVQTKVNLDTRMPRTPSTFLLVTISLNGLLVIINFLEGGVRRDRRGVKNRLIQ